jgi:hypothetical protein
MDAIIQRAMAKDKLQRFSTAVEMTNALREAARGDPTQLQVKATPTIKASVQPIPQKKGFNALLVVVPVIAIAVLAGGFFFVNGRKSPTTEAPVSTATLAPLPTKTSALVNNPTNIPVVEIEPTITETSLPPTPTEITGPVIPSLGGADKIAFIANSELWVMNVDGSDLKQLTVDGGVKNDVQWLPDGENIVFISGLTVKYYNIKTDVVDTLTSFPSASSLNAFRVSHDGKQVMIAMNNEIFVVPFGLDTLKDIHKKSDLLALEPCIVPEGKTKSALVVKEARWATDDQLVAWLYKGPFASDQVSVLDIHDCDPSKIKIVDTFPGTHFEIPGFQSGLLLDFDWDGFNQFVFNTARRNVGWGDLHIYNWESHKPTLTINPVDRKCCYRDARWSPDGTYLFFTFQDAGLAANSQALFYYVPYGDIGAGANLTPIQLPDGFFKNPKEAPQPALRPAQ